MASIINTNMASLNAQRNLGTSQSALATALQRLSSGLRINSAKDDAAGMAIASRMSSQISGNTQAARNANDGISLAQTAEGDMAQISNNLQRMRDLAVQAANATNSTSDRATLNNEMQALAAEIDRVAQNSSFNGVKLLDGSFTAQNFQVGAGNTANDQVTIASINSARTSALGVAQGFSITSGAIVAGTAGTLTVTQTGGSTVAIAAVASDAKTMAAAINNQGIAGLTATANATVATGNQTGAAATTAGGTATLTLNGIAITGIVMTTNNTTNQANVLAAITANSAATGVTAVDTGTGLKLTATDGRNIVVDLALTGGTTGTNAASVGLGGVSTLGGAGTTTTGTFGLAYTLPSGSAVTNIAVTYAGGTGTLGATTSAVASTGTAVSAISISTPGGATSALTTIDAAIASINTSRASLGAYQNRFTSVVASLQTTSENLTASRSRIQDADFAAETASLTRAQILQQAGTAMLAQANALPNGVMALLR